MVMDFRKFDYYLGESLYQSRVSKHMKQSEMAKGISDILKANGKKKGISNQAYAYYERGERSMPWDVFTAACDILSLDRNRIFNEACDYIKVE